ncbi:MAG: SPFH domain-containing protein [Phycisphaerales bacterium]|jgi:regulator of protease activity HflC (stomatin/prohibitin superfamily)
MKKTIPIIVGLLLLAVLVLFNTTYTVAFNEVAIKTRLGRSEGVVRDPGLHLKAPFFVDRVTKLDRRLQLVDSPLETAATRDGEQVLAQAFLLWRLAESDQGVLSFYEGFGSIDEASRTLEPLLGTSLHVLIDFDFGDLIGPTNRLPEAEQRILAELKRSMPPGIEAVGVGLSQIVLPPKASQAVLRRMIATQQALATLERSRGDAEAQLIQSAAATKADKIRAFAEQRAKEIEAEGNRAAGRYFEQMRENQSLAIFLSWLDAFRASMSGNAVLFADTTRAPLHLFDLNARVGPDGIPLPAREFDAPPIAPKTTDPKAGAAKPPDGKTPDAKGADGKALAAPATPSTPGGPR